MAQVTELAYLQEQLLVRLLVCVEASRRGKHLVVIPEAKLVMMLELQPVKMRDTL